MTAPTSPTGTQPQAPSTGQPLRKPITAAQAQLRASAAVVAGVLALLALFAGVAGALLWSAVPADVQATVATALAPKRAVLVVIALALALAAAALAQPLLRRWLIAPRELNDAAALLVHGPLQSTEVQP